MANTNYTDTNGTIRATQQINSDNSGFLVGGRRYYSYGGGYYIGTRISFVAGNTISNVNVDTNGDLQAVETASNGIVDRFNVGYDSSYHDTLNAVINGHRLSYDAGAADSIDNIIADTKGNIDIKHGANAAHSWDYNSDLFYNTDGSAKFVATGEKVIFAANVLTGINTSGLAQNNASSQQGYFFSLTSAASGFSEDIAWSPYQGTTYLDLTNNTTHTTVRTKLGVIGNGRLQVLGSSAFVLYDSTGHALSGTEVNSDGSQTDFNNNADGSSDAYEYNAAGVLTSYTTYATDNSSTSYKYDSSGNLQARKHINSDQSGFVGTADNNTFRFAAGSDAAVIVYGPSNVALSEITSGGQNVDLTQTAPLAVTVGINGHALAVDYKVDDFNIDASGNVVATGRLTGFAGGDKLTINNADATANFVIGSDTLNFNLNTLHGIDTPGLSNPNNGFAFDLTSAAAGFNEDISWSPTTGKALLNLTNTTTGSTFSSSLGHINPGDALNVFNNSLIGLYDPSGHLLNTTTIRADGGQTDTNFNPDGSVASTYTYDATGHQVAQLASAMSTFGVTSGGATAPFVLPNASNPHVLAAAH